MPRDADGLALVVAVDMRRKADAAVGHLKPALWGTKAVDENDLTATDLSHELGITKRAHTDIVMSSTCEAHGVAHMG